MTGGPFWAEVLFALAALVLVLGATRWAAKSDKELGRQAFRDGLSYNPKWGASICEGYREARSEAEAYKLAEFVREDKLR